MKKLVSTLFIAALLLVGSSGSYGAGSPEGLAALRAFEAQQIVEGNAFSKKQADEIASLKNKQLAEAATFKKAAQDKSDAKNKELVTKYGATYAEIAPAKAPAPAKAAAPKERWIDNKDGTVTDTQEGLMWADQDNGKDISYSNAKSYCLSYKGGGKTGWRMPTSNELIGLDRSFAYGSRIKKTASVLWAVETVGADAAYYDFRGLRGTAPQSTTTGARALPVRSAK